MCVCVEHSGDKQSVATTDVLAKRDQKPRIAAQCPFLLTQVGLVLNSAPVFQWLNKKTLVPTTALRLPVLDRAPTMAVCYISSRDAFFCSSVIADPNLALKSSLTTFP